MTSKLRTPLFALGFIALGAIGGTTALALAEDDADCPHARGGFGERGGHGGMFLREAMEDLDLTDDQQAKLESLRDGMQEEREAHRGERQERMEELVTLLQQDKVDRRELRGRVDARLDEVRDRMYGMADELADFHASLSPEQRATLVAKLQEVQTRMEERHEGSEGEEGARERGPGRRR